MLSCRCLNKVQVAKFARGQHVFYIAQVHCISLIQTIECLPVGHYAVHTSMTRDGSLVMRKLAVHARCFADLLFDFL